MKKLIAIGAVVLLTLGGDSPAPSQTSGTKLDKLMAAKLIAVALFVVIGLILVYIGSRKSSEVGIDETPPPT